MLVFNHVSIFDPPFMIAFWPELPEVLGAIDVWNRPGQNILAGLYGAIPIRRGEVDRAAMEKMLRVLRGGRPLMVAPEGTRSHEPGLQMGKPGIIYIIEQTKVPVIPVGIVGTTDDFLKRVLRWERPQLEMNIGEPFYLPSIDEAGLTPKEIRQRKVDYIMRKIAALLPDAYRGIYASQRPLRSEPAQTGG